MSEGFLPDWLRREPPWLKEADVGVDIREAESVEFQMQKHVDDRRLVAADLEKIRSIVREELAAAFREFRLVRGEDME